MIERALASMPHLRHLRLSPAWYLRQTMPSLAAQSRLRSLALTTIGLDDAACATLGAVSSLASLRLEYVNAASADVIVDTIRRLVVHAGLRRLDVFGGVLASDATTMQRIRQASPTLAVSVTA